MSTPEPNPNVSPECTRRAFLHRSAGGLAACGLTDAVQAAPADSSNGPAEEKGYPLYRAAGTHRELGRQHGEQAAAKIKAHLDYMAQSLKLSAPQVRERAARFKPLFRQHCPHLLEELEGLAEGAGVTEADALAVNIRGVLTKAAAEGCTTFVVGPRGTAAGQVLIGQNSDVDARVAALAYVLHLKPKGKPEILMWTFGGMIGYHGVNSAGVAHFANDLGEGGPKPRFALPHYPVKRLMHEYTKVGEVVELLRRVPVAVNGNYVLCDGAGAILDVEATSAGPELLRDAGAGFLAHTNHYVCGAYATEANHKQCVADSFPRLKRMNALLGEKFGKLTAADLKRFLADHDGHPSSICRHPRGQTPDWDFAVSGETVAAIVAVPAERKLFVTRGNPCTHRFVEYAMGS